MSLMTIACIAFSAGGALAILAIGLFLLLDKGPDPVPLRVGLVLVLLAALGIGTCAAEDRMCEAAGMAGG